MSVTITFTVDSGIDAGALIAFNDMLNHEEVLGTEIDTYLGYIWDTFADYFDVWLESGNCHISSEFKEIIKREIESLSEEP